MQKINIKDVKVGDRARADFGDLEDLAESLITYGFIHPIALDANGQIVAGGRRFAALSQIWEEREDYVERDDADASMLRFLRNGDMELGIHFTSKIDSDLEACDEMELEENVRRKNFTWKEEVVAIHKIHKRNRKRARERGDNWGVRETARLLGVSGASISYATKLYACLQDPKHPIHDSTSATDALHKLAELKAEEARRLAVSRNVLQKPKPKTGGVDVSLDELGAELDEELEEFNFDETSGQLVSQPYQVSVEQDGTEEAQIAEFEKATEELVDLNKFKHGDFLSLVESGELPKGYFDHILTDPPYGIDVKNMVYGGSQTDHKRIEGTHNAQDNQALFHSWLQAFYDLLKDSGWCLVWCDYEHFNTLSNLAKAVGFTPQRWPFVWCKTHSCMNQAADFNFTKNTEACLVLRKGNATLVKPQTTSYYLASNTNVKQQLPGHPFVKPLELWQHLAKAVALEGERILDPFAGVGSSTRALIEDYDVWSCEIDEDIYNQQLGMLMKFYREIYPNAKFVK